LFLDGLAGGLVCRSFLDMPESRRSGPAQSERRHTAKRCVDEIHLDLPFGKYFLASPVPLRTAPVVQGAWAVSVKKSFGCGDKF
jgi:hypothetical protein